MKAEAKSLGLDVDADIKKGSIAKLKKRVQAEIKAIDPDIKLDVKVDERDFAKVRADIAALSAFGDIEAIDNESLAIARDQLKVNLATVEKLVAAEAAELAIEKSMITARKSALALSKLQVKEATAQLALADAWDAASVKHSAQMVKNLEKQGDLRQKWIDAGRKADAGFERTIERQNKLRQDWISAGQKFDAQMARSAAAQERALARAGGGGRSALSSLRGLRDDMTSLDQAGTRLFRHAALGFSLLSGSAVAAFGVMAAVGIAKYGELEEAANKASSVFASGIVSENMAKGIKTTEAAFLDLNSTLRNKLIQTAREVGIATSFSADEVATGIESLAQAGIGIEDARKGIATVAQFAQASGEDMVTTSELLVQGFIGAGNSADEFGEKVGRLSDELTFAATDSAQSLKDILQGFQNDAAAAFTAYGQSASETINVLNLLGSAGIKGLKGGTSAAIVIRDIFKSANASPEAFKKYGIAVTNADGTTRSFAAILDDLTHLFREQTNEFTQPKRFDALRKEFGFQLKSFRQLQSLLVTTAKLQRKGSGAQAKLNKQVAEAGGLLQLRSEAVVQTFTQRFQQFRETIGALLGVFGAPAAQLLTEFFGRLTKGGLGANSMFKHLQDRARDFGKVFRDNLEIFLKQITGPEGKAFFAGIVDGMSGVLKGVKGFFTEFTEAFNGGTESGKSFLEILGDFAAAFGQLASDILPRVGSALGQIGRYLSEHPEAVKNTVEAMIGLLVVSKAIRIVVLPLVSIFRSLSSVFTSGKGLFAEGGILAKFTQLGTKADGAVLSLKTLGAVFSKLFVPVTIAIALIEGLIGAFEEFKLQLDPMKKDLHELGSEFTKIGVTSERAGAVMRFALSNLSTVLEAPLRILKGIGTVIAGSLIFSIRGWSNAINILFDLMHGDLQAVKRDLGDIKGAFIDLFGSILRGTLLPFLESLDDMFDAFSRLPGVSNKFGEALDGTIDKIREFGVEEDSAGKKGEGAFSSINGWIEATNASLAGTTAATDDVREAFKVAGREGEGAARRTWKSWIDAQHGIELASDGIKDGVVSSFKTARSAINTESFQTGKTIETALLPPGLSDIINPRAKEVGASAGQTMVHSFQEAVKFATETAIPKVSASVQRVVDAIKMVQGQLGEKTSNPLARTLVEIEQDVGHLEKTLVAIRRAAGKVILSLRVSIGRQAPALARKLADMVLSLGGVAIRNVRAITPILMQAGALIATSIANGLKLQVFMLAESIKASGVIMMAFFGAGMRIGAALYVLPFIPRLIARVIALLKAGVPLAFLAGSDVMIGFYNGLNFIYTTKVQPLILSIASWIRANKGPISYDQTLLRPAGEAIMEGFATGLQDGFGEIKGWVSEVGPYMADLIDDDMFFKKSANFLIGNAGADLAFDPHKAFDDLLPDIPLGLHPTTSAADTASQAHDIASFYGASINSLRRLYDTVAGAGVSQHLLGQAGDFGPPGAVTERMAKGLSLLIDKVFKQIIWNNSLWRGGKSGFGYVGGHKDHLHAGWVPAGNFSIGAGGFRQHGGMVNQGSAYVTGENGPELFIPSSRGNVMTNSDMQTLVNWLRDSGSASGAGSVTNNQFNTEIKTNSSDPETVGALWDARMRSTLTKVQR